MSAMALESCSRLNTGRDRRSIRPGCDFFLVSGKPMINPKSHTGHVICRQSQFLDDFPADLVEVWKAGNEDASIDDEPF